MEQPYRLPDGSAVTSMLSVGVAFFAEHGETAEALLRHADAAMYADKQGRKGQTEPT